MTFNDFKYEFKMAWRRSPAIWTIIGINIGITLLCCIAELREEYPSPSPVFWFAVVSPASVFASRPWTLLTYMFTQTSMLHLLFNMLWLYWFGSVLAERVGQRGIWRTYLIGGLAGGIFFLAPGFILSKNLLMGASASVVAIMVEAALRMPDREFRLFLIGSVKLKWLAIISLIVLLLGIGKGNVGAQAAHLGGALAGLLIFLIGKIRRRNVWQPQRSARRTAKAMTTAMTTAKTDMQKLDALLDKIKLSSYDSLTAKEKEELHRLSDR